MAAPVPLGTQQNGDNRTGGTFDGQRAAMSTPAPAPAPAPAPEPAQEEGNQLCNQGSSQLRTTHVL